MKSIKIEGFIDYGTYKDGSSIFKNNKGYYIFNINNKGEEYKKYLKKWKPTGDYEPLYLDKSKKKWITQKKWIIQNPKLNKLKNKTKKLNRPSPPYPANDYCGKNKKGNDRNMYISTKNKIGICRWVKLK
jgi:hypothetical protein